MNVFWIMPLCAAVAVGGVLLHRRIDTRHDDAAPRPAAPTLTEPHPPLADRAPPHADPELNAIARLHSELRALESNIVKRERIQIARRSSIPAEPEPPTLRVGLTPDQWQFAGRSTPESSVETALWAGARGDTQAMLESIALDEQALQIATDLFARLPSDLQLRSRSAEDLVAALIVDDIPLAQARILAKSSIDDTTQLLSLAFTSNIDAAKLVRLRFQKQPNGDWKLAVPPSAISNYARELGLPPASTQSASQPKKRNHR